jgi:hypothetical protein
MSALEGSGSGKKKLTVEELKARIAARRIEIAETEKKDEINREKVRAPRACRTFIFATISALHTPSARQARREMGKNMGKTKEELDRLQRQREIAMRKKEKLDAQRERERLRAEIAKDKVRHTPCASSVPQATHRPPCVRS